MPTVSIVIPCYQHQQVLIRAVASARAQVDAPKYEIIVVDDGSTPQVEEMDGVRLIRHQENRGLAAALNTGIEASRASRFVILAADDELRKDHLKETTCHNKDIVSCDMLAANTHVRMLPGNLKLLETGNCHSYAALVKKSMFKKVGGFKDMNPSWEDWEFWLNCAKHKAEWHHIPKPLHIYHKTSTGRDAQAQGKDRMLQGMLQGYHQDIFGVGRGVVGIVIPCYNHEEFVSEAVESALSQDYPHIRVVVVDDGSPGDVEKALDRISTPERVSIIKQRNRGLSGARNSGMQYLMGKFSPEYMVMLDADDKIHDTFVTETMASMGDHEFVYSNIQFFGTAWHTYDLPKWDKEKLLRKHLHPCTFLMKSDMIRDVIECRGYGYDEDMREGFEDWEFSIASAICGWSGKLLKGYLFYYRQHPDGSMRTVANKISSKLSHSIRDKHSWISQGGWSQMAGCTSCGGRRIIPSKGGNAAPKIFVPAIGEVQWDAPLKATYTGITTSTMTKIGHKGQIYRFSGDQAKQARGYGPELIIKAVDAHMFSGHFTIEQIQPVAKIEPGKIRDEPNFKQAKTSQTPRGITVVHTEEPPKTEEEKKKREGEAIQERAAQVVIIEDDLTQVKGIGPTYAQKLKSAGYTLIVDIAGALPGELGMILRLKPEKVESLIAAATEEISGS